MRSISPSFRVLRALHLLVWSVLLTGLPPLSAQAPAPGNPIDEIKTIEAFEDRRPAGRKWNLVFKMTPGVRGYLTTSDLETPPTAKSNRYMSINFFGKRGNGVRIVPPETRVIKGYVREIRIWVFGFGKADELYVDITDKKNTPHRLFLGNLKFSGWKLLRVKPPKHIFQRGERIVDARSGLIFRGLFLVPHYRSRAGIVRLYLDEIEAITRPYHRKPTVRWRY